MLLFLALNKVEAKGRHCACNTVVGQYGKCVLVHIALLIEHCVLRRFIKLDHEFYEVGVLSPRLQYLKPQLTHISHFIWAEGAVWLLRVTTSAGLLE